MQKNILFYLIAFGLLLFSVIFFNNAYQQVIDYTKLIERCNTVYGSFQNLSKDINNAAVINPDLIKASTNENGLNLFFTDSQGVVKTLDVLTSVVKDSVTIKIIQNLHQLIKNELSWIIASNVPDSIIHNKAAPHLAALLSINSLIDEGINRTNFLINYHKDQLKNAIATEQSWMIIFIVLPAALICYFSFTLFRQNSKIKNIETQLSTVLSRIQDGVISLDNSWRYTFVNDASLRINGKKKSDLIGHALWDVHPEIKNTPSWNLLRDAKISMQALEDEIFSPEINSWFAVKIYPSNDGITVYYSDITERKKAAAQKNLLVSIIDSSEDAIISKTPEGIVTSWNRSAKAIFGYSEEEMVGKSIRVIIPHDLQNEEDDIMDKIKNGKYVEHYETERIRKDGQRINISLSVSPILDIQGNITGASKIARDITDKKKAENAILMANKEKNAILESIDDAFFAVDKNWTVTYWNREAEKKLQKAKKDIIGYNLWDVFGDSVASTSYKKYHEAVTTNQALYFEDYYAPLDKWYDISAYPSGDGLAVYFKDITERKYAEIQLNELNESLQIQTKELARSNAELEQFAYVASHDMQEPLRMISSFLTQLEKKYAGIIDEKGKTYIGFAVDGAKRMRQIILDLLEFSRVGKTEDKKEDVDINKLIGEIKILFRKQIEDKMAAIKLFELPVICTYKIPLYQVFQNLIGNALKYASADRPCQIEISAEDLRTHWQFTIADNGIGINEEFFEKIFIIFQRLHNKDDYSGTGMGLAITKKIINNLGGKIWVNSAEGKGSAFYFTIKK